MQKTEAARYLGISASTFDRRVRDGLIPAAKPQGGRVTWDVRDLDSYADDLPYHGETAKPSLGTPVAI